MNNAATTQEAPRKARTAKERRDRQPFAVMRKKLSVDQNTLDKLEKMGKVPRFVNDDNHGSNVRMRIDQGYDFVSNDGDIIVGDVLKSEDAGRRLRVLVGTNKDNSPLYAYLMAIDKEFYEEDQAKKEEQNKMVDDAIRGGTPPGLKGHGVAPEQGGANIKKVQYEP